MKTVKGKKVPCPKCGKPITNSSKGFGSHKRFCSGKPAKEENKPTRKYTKRKKDDMVVFADVRLKINLTKALKMGIACVASESEV